MKIIVPLKQASISHTHGVEGGVPAEFDASSAGEFAERMAKFLASVGHYCYGGASRTIGIIDAPDDVGRAITLHVDSGGAEFLRGLKLSATEVET